MSTTITYKGSTLTTVNNQTRTLNTSGKYLEDNITLVDVTSGGGGGIYQSKTVTPTSSSQTVTADSGYDALSAVTVESIPSQYIIPEGVSTITANGTYDVEAFASAVVSVPGGTDVNFADIIAEKNVVEAIGKNATTIENGAFSGYSHLTTASFSKVTTIKPYAFMMCPILATISFPSATQIGNGAFARCSCLTAIDFPNVTSIGSSAFSYCSNLTTISFPNATDIGSGAFCYCSKLTTVNFPNATGILQSYAFQSCYELTTVSLSKISYINFGAFNSCYNLLSLYLLGSVKVQLNTNTAFTSTPIAGYTTSTGGVYGSIFVPASLYDSYIIAVNWSAYSSRFVSV